MIWREGGVIVEAFAVSVFGYKLFNELYTIFITKFKGRDGSIHLQEKGA